MTRYYLIEIINGIYFCKSDDGTMDMQFTKEEFLEKCTHNQIHGYWHRDGEIVKYYDRHRIRTTCGRNKE
mgnify:CR=1 FL=1